MKKNIVRILVIFLVFIGINIITTPIVNKSKIFYSDGLGYEEQSLGEKENNNVVEELIVLQIQLDYKLYDKDELTIDGNTSKEVVKKLRKDLRNKSKQYHIEKNNDIYKDIDFGYYQDIYVSRYAPFIDVTYNKDYFNSHKNDILYNITKHDKVKYVTINEQCVYESTIAYACNRTGMESVYQNRTYTAADVNIGILENGIIDVDNRDLLNTDIIIRSSIYNAFGQEDHTTHMALIIAGDHGIVPDATILNAYLFGSMTDEVEWMLDNDVDIINMSCSETETDGEYNATSAYVDYIMSEHYVIFVVSAGNKGESTGYLSNPSLSYNAITVGSISGDYQRSSFSSFITVDGATKPTICTFGDGVMLYDEDFSIINGTSPATALVTGFIAVIVDQYSTLVVNREKLHALIVANAYNSNYQSFTKENGFDLEVGAGSFHYGNIIENYNLSAVLRNNSGVEGSTISSETIYLEAGQTVRASLSTIATSDGTVAGLEFTDYDIGICNSNGALLEIANSIDSVIEVVTYTATVSGYYKIEVYQATDRVKNVDYVGTAYRIY